MGAPSILSGYNHEPWFIEPATYDIIAYPAEWLFEGMMPDKRMRALSPYFYNRNWGKSKVVNLVTLFYRKSLSEVIGEDATVGVKTLFSSSVQFSTFSSNSLALIQEGRLKEMSVDHRKQLGEYIACPMVPADVEAFKVYSLNLGAPMPLERAVEKLKSIK